MNTLAQPARRHQDHRLQNPQNPMMPHPASSKPSVRPPSLPPFPTLHLTPVVCPKPKGYKEFSSIPTADLVPSAASTPAFKEAIDRMKTTTRQYAKSQVKWISGKLKGAVEERVEDGKEGMFLLDASGPFHLVLSLSPLLLSTKKKSK